MLSHNLLLQHLKSLTKAIMATPPSLHMMHVKLRHEVLQVRPMALSTVTCS